jgi:hypothetical protein
MANNFSGWTQVKMILLVGLAVVRATLAGTFGFPGAWGRASVDPSLLCVVPPEMLRRTSR